MSKEQENRPEALWAARREMVQSQMRRRALRDERVLAAFEEVPRERFIPADQRDDAFADQPVPIGFGQTISQPYVVALMVAELDVRPTHRVLDVGAGSGYQTAILARLAAHVYAIERIAELADRAAALLAELGIRNVSLRTGDGSLGWPEQAPFDRIICGAAAPDVPAAWVDQLVEGGRIVAPLGGPDCQDLLALDKRQGRLHRREICGVRFVHLIGRQGWEGP